MSSQSKHESLHSDHSHHGDDIDSKEHIAKHGFITNKRVLNWLDAKAEKERKEKEMRERTAQGGIKKNKVDLPKKEKKRDRVK